MLTCTCRTQSSLCSSVIYEVMSMMIEQRRDLNVSLCVKLLQSATRSLLSAQTLPLTLIVIWLNLTGLPWIRRWTGSSCLTQISVPGQRWTTSQSECWGQQWFFICLIYRLQIFSIWFLIVFLCCVLLTILFCQDRSAIYTVNNLLLDLGYWHVKQLLLLLST